LIRRKILTPKISSKKWLDIMTFQGKKADIAKRAPGGRKRKIPSRSLHGQGVQVSVDERVADLARRYPAMHSALGPLLIEGKKRIRDFPAPDQLRLLRMVYALKKASRG
jgi:hypothetical protein